MTWPRELPWQVKIHHWPECDRSSSHNRRHPSCSISWHSSRSHYPSTDRYSTRHSHRDTLHCHRHNTSSHSWCWNHSWHFSTDCSWSNSRNSSGTNHRSHIRNVSKPYSLTETPNRPKHYKKVTLHDSPMHSSSESDDDSGTLNY